MFQQSGIPAFVIGFVMRSTFFLSCFVNKITLFWCVGLVALF